MSIIAASNGWIFLFAVYGIYRAMTQFINTKFYQKAEYYKLVNESLAEINSEADDLKHVFPNIKPFAATFSKLLDVISILTKIVIAVYFGNTYFIIFSIIGSVPAIYFLTQDVYAPATEKDRYFAFANNTYILLHAILCMVYVFL